MKYQIILNGEGIKPKSLRSCIDFFLVACYTINFSVKTLFADENNDQSQLITIKAFSTGFLVSLRLWNEQGRVSLNIAAKKTFKRNTIINAFRAYFKPAISTEIKHNFPRDSKTVEEGPWIDKRKN